MTPQRKKSRGQPSRSRATQTSERVRVLVDMRVPIGQVPARSFAMAEGLSTTSFQLDTDYEPVPSSPPDTTRAMELEASREEIVTVRGTIEKDKIDDLKAQDNVIAVWLDTPIAPFASQTLLKQEHFVEVSAATGNCPIPPCDCDQGTPACSKGSIQDVVCYLGIDQIWAAGYRGDGIVIGMVDGGITALNRVPKPGETANIPRVIGGWPSADWGTTAAAWEDHGNMTATDALGMAPQAQLYDIRISDGNAISNGLAGFQWAINQHKTDGTPHILSNSWGIFQESWDSDYATNANHPFTRKVVEAINEGIIVLFAAGNCGETCPSGRCGNDVGPGKSIWGANGHALVMTVGAANIQEHWIGYSSQGPAALDPHKPDFCSISHFTGYFSADTGTSAACPVAAGVVALLKQAKPSLTQGTAKDVLKATAKNIGPAGWDPHSGSGIIQAKAAFDQIVSPQPGGCERYRTLAFQNRIQYIRSGIVTYLFNYYGYMALFYRCRRQAAGEQYYQTLYCTR